MKKAKFSIRLLLVSLTLMSLSLSLSVALAAEDVDVTDIPIESGHYQLGLMTAYRPTQGAWDPYGNYTTYPDGSVALSVFTTISFSYRFNKDWEIGLSLPIRQSRMIMPTGDSASTIVGGFGGDVRYHVGGWPHLILHAGVGTPWNWRHMTVNGDPRASFSTNDLSTDISGWSMRVGAGVSRTFYKVRAAFDLSAGIPIGTSDMTSDGPPLPGPPPQVGQGKRIQALEGLSYLATKQWSINSGLRQSWAMDTSVNGVAVDGSAGRLFTTSIGLSYNPSHDWRWTGSFDTPYPFYSYAVNQPYSPTFAVSMVYMGI